MMIAEKTYQYLKFCNLTDLQFWDYYTLSIQNSVVSSYPIIELGSVIEQRKGSITISDDKEYKRCRVQISGNGVILRDLILGKEIKVKKQQLCKKNDFLVASIDAKVGGFGIVPQDLEDAIVSGHYFLFEIDTAILLPEFLGIIVKTNSFQEQVKSTGSTNYAAIRPYHVLGYKIPLPPLVQQEKIVKNYYEKIKESEKLNLQANDLGNNIERYLFDELGIEKTKAQSKKDRGLQLVNFSEVQEWGIDKLSSKSNKSSSKYSLISINSFPTISINLFRGKSPKYKSGTSAFILNQKCNRWNNIDLSFVKTVDEDWIKSISNNFLTKEGDVLINSTGDGTIGRASFITKEFEGLLYDSHILLLRLNPLLINAELFVEIFNSEYGQNQVNDIKSAQATKQTELGISNLSRIKFPLVENLKTQNDIMNKVNEMRFQKNNLINRAKLLKIQAEEEFEQTISLKYEDN